MGYKNKTNKEYQHEYYSKNKVKRNQYNKDYYLANHDYIRVYQYLYHRNKKYERNKNENNVVIVSKEIIISILEN